MLVRDACVNAVYCILTGCEYVHKVSRKVESQLLTGQCALLYGELSIGFAVLLMAKCYPYKIAIVDRLLYIYFADELTGELLCLGAHP